MSTFRNTVRQIQAQTALRETALTEAVYLGNGAAVSGAGTGIVKLISRLTTGPGWRVTVFYPETDPDGRYPLGTLLPQMHMEYDTLAEVAAEHFEEWEPYRRKNPTPELLIQYALENGEWKWTIGHGGHHVMDEDEADRFASLIFQTYELIQEDLSRPVSQRQAKDTTGLDSIQSFRYIDYSEPLFIGANVKAARWVTSYHLEFPYTYGGKKFHDYQGGRSMHTYITPAGWTPQEQYAAYEKIHRERIERSRGTPITLPKRKR